MFDSMTSPRTEWNVYDIVYDMETDDTQVNVPVPPTEMVIVLDCIPESEEHACELIADIISDTTGWCVESFDIQEI